MAPFLIFSFIFDRQLTQDTGTTLTLGFAFLYKLHLIELGVKK